jgi:hypothetical protein
MKTFRLKVQRILFSTAKKKIAFLIFNFEPKNQPGLGPGCNQQLPVLFVQEELSDQGDQMGRIFANWVIDSFGGVF